MDIGDRVAVGIDYATVRYIGPVVNQEGSWIGLEWDDPSRGKHDGSTGGIKYFTVSSGHPTGGSFVREPKVDRGTTLLAAIQARYRPGEAETEFDELYANTAKGSRRVAIEVVGVEKIMRRQGQLSELRAAFVPDSKVSRPCDAPGELASTCPALEELDLSGNLIPGWARVQAICQELPALKVLHLSRVPLGQPAAGAALPALARLETLVLKGCPGLEWSHIIALAPHTPALVSLHLGGNSIASLGGAEADTSDSEPSAPISPALFPNLQILDLEANKLASWSEVWRLRDLPKLKSLTLNDNCLTSVSYKAGPEGGRPPFASLQVLLLGGNQLSAWSDVDAVHMMPAVTEARFTGNPVVDRSEWGSRTEAVARVGRLSVLNGSTVGAMERRDCEVRYVRNCEAERLANGWTTEKISEAHPRYPELAARFAGYLTAVAAAQAAEGAGGMASDMASLRLTCVSAAKGAKMGSQDKKLPLSMKLDKVKMLCERLFGVKATEAVLFFKVSFEEPMPEPMGADDSRDLSYFNARDGAEIIVDSVGLGEAKEAERRAREEARRERGEREARQLHEKDSLNDY